MSDFDEKQFTLLSVNFEKGTALVSTGSAETNTSLRFATFDMGEVGEEFQSVGIMLKLITASHLGILQAQDLVHQGLSIDDDPRTGVPYDTKVSCGGRMIYPQGYIPNVLTEQLLNNVVSFLYITSVSVENCKMTISARLHIGHSLAEDNPLGISLLSKAANIKFPPLNLIEGKNGTYTVWTKELNKIWDTLKEIMMMVFLAHARKIEKDKESVQLYLFQTETADEQGERSNDDEMKSQHERQ